MTLKGRVSLIPRKSIFTYKLQHIRERVQMRLYRHHFHAPLAALFRLMKDGGNGKGGRDEPIIGRRGRKRRSFTRRTREEDLTVKCLKENKNKGFSKQKRLKMIE